MERQSGRHWKPPSSLLPPVRSRKESIDPIALPVAGKTDGESFHIVSAKGRFLGTPTTASTYVAHTISKKVKPRAENFDGSKVSGLGYAVTGLAEAKEWISTTQSTFGGVTKISRRQKSTLCETRATPQTWDTEAKRAYGSHHADVISQCRLRRQELANRLVAKKDTPQRMEFM